ncbi:hypothetical protein BU26DRAFT_558938 [Trematosphaeria pertusa]|uniref:Uncharacterized protein n=1 Tax=Trematosphaeria pertusa TaxID=390896 RepID=A0A6A6IUX9_9PLEO|nr:uncharacterized protein BU26DRAFT_558938 [Trematosphaeria pertusa]KAF2254229.1 hypothetical protein BU26DRAFT_558938 [Trematosphaeria pertusa]
MSLPSIAESYNAHIAAGGTPESYARPPTSPGLLRQQFMLPASPAGATAILAHSSLAYRQLAADLHARLKRSDATVAQLRDEKNTLLQRLDPHRTIAVPGGVLVFPLICGFLFVIISGCVQHFPKEFDLIDENTYAYLLVWVIAEFLLGTNWMRRLLWSGTRWVAFAMFLSQTQAWATASENRRYWFIQYLFFLVLGQVYIRIWLANQRMEQEVDFLNKRLLPLERWHERRESRESRESSASRFSSTAFLEGFGFGMQKADRADLKLGLNNAR